MPDIHCPVCDRLNAPNADRCWFCQADLHPADALRDDDSAAWLEGLRQGSDASTDKDATSPTDNDSPVSSNDSAEESDQEIPEWLARIRSRKQSEEGSSEEEETPAESAEPDGMDWLHEIQSENEQPVPEPENNQPAVPSDSENIPEQNSDDDWLKKLESWNEDSVPAENEPAKETPAGSKTQALFNEPEPVNDQNNPAEGSPAPDSTPDWLSSFIDEGKTTSDIQKEPASEPQESKEPSPVEPEILQPISAEETAPQPKEIASTGEKTPAPSEAQPDEAQSVATPGESSSGSDSSEQTEPEEENWLAAYKKLSPDEQLDSQVMPQIQKNSEEKAPFDDKTLMDWMDDSETAAAPVEPEPKKNLEPAALPGWLQALRPERKTGSKTAGQAQPQIQEPASSTIEESGPLAGIEGILQSEELSKYYSKPHTYNNNSLKISEGQLARSKILKSIADKSQWIEEETNKKTRSFSWFVRLITVVLMLAAVLIPLLFTGIPHVTSSLYPEEVVKTFNTVNSLSTEKPVLIAADFDSSLYGELNWSMQPLVTQLMNRNIPIAFLSTNSVGATLMDQSLSQMIKNSSTYSAAQLVDLGYLAGGSIGMQSLVQDLRTTLPYTSDLKSPWNASPLNTVNKLSDFGALIIITENADTARYWIEQVKPSLGEVPMLVVISAQSAPLLQPYFDSSQINGYISGLNSAAAYEALNQTPQSATNHLTSYQAVMILVALFILIGGIVSLILYRPASEKKKG
jgi:hypothetical protein